MFYSEKTSEHGIYICISHWNFIVIRSETNEKMDPEGYYHQNKQGCEDQEPMQSSNTPDPGYQCESDKLTVRHHKREPRGQCALWSPVGKGLASWLSFVVYNCEFVTVPLESWVRCGT